MPERNCQTCKYFEPSATPNKGWCRNSALYAPHQSHAVAPDTLDCAGRRGNFWEAAPDMIDEPSGTARAVRAFGERQRLRLFQPPAQLVPAPAGMIASYGRGGDDPGGRDEPRAPSRSSGSGGGSRTPGTGGLSGNRTGSTQGQERTVSYQPEERYWTDYLRIALPIVGLLLMLALFWFWAAKIIGSDSSAPPTVKPQATTLVITATAPPPTATTKAGIVANGVTPTATLGADTGQPTSPSNAGATDTPAASANPTPLGAGFTVGEAVVANDDVNLRSDASSSADAIGTLAKGDELEITSEAVKSGGYFWVGVKVTSGDLTGQTGFVADKFLDPAS
jgi:hypothetical protein